MRLSKENWHWAVIVILLLALIGMGGWAANERARATEALQAQKSAMQNDHQAQMEALNRQWQHQLDQRLTTQAASHRQALNDETTGLLRAVAVPLGWAVRNEMSAKNQGRVRSYFDDLVGYPGVRNIELVDSGGKVLVATDKAREGAQIDGSYPADAQTADKPTVFHTGGDSFVAAVPIFGVSTRQGTVLLSYDRSAAAGAAAAPPPGPSGSPVSPAETTPSQ